MQERMKNPLFVLPEALKALQAAEAATHSEGLPLTTCKLVMLRASQINGCSFCVDMHSKELRHAGVADQKIFAVAAWRETRGFTPAERAALALAEAATRLADRPEAITEEIWADAARWFDEKALAGLVLQIGLINLFNRVNAAIRMPVGEAA